METQLYMRVRGRVLGPYEPDKLQTMVRRGQLSRMHELSTDGVSWVRASNYPELFTTNVELPTQQSNSTSKEETAPSSSVLGNGTTATVQLGAAANAPAMTESKWYYSRAGIQAGPIDISTLRTMAFSGQLGPDDLIWTDGMGEWQVARNVPGLTWAPLTGATTFGHQSAQHFAGERHSTRSEGEVVLPDGLVRSAIGARSWVIFVSIVLFVLAALMALGGIGLIVEGGRSGENRSVSGGIFSLLTAVVVAVGALMLINYGTRLGGLRYSPAPILLERALDSLRAFWLYVGICLIVWLVFLVIAMVFGAAMIPT